MEYDISRDNTNNFAENTGIRIQGGLASAAVDIVQVSLENAIRLGANIGAAISGEKDEVVIGVRTIGGATEDYYSTMSWRELS